MFNPPTSGSLGDNALFQLCLIVRAVCEARQVSTQILQTSDILGIYRPLPRTTSRVHITRPVPGYQMPGSQLTLNNPNPTNLAASQPSMPPLLAAKVHSMKRRDRLTNGNRDWDCG